MAIWNESQTMQPQLCKGTYWCTFEKLKWHERTAVHWISTSNMGFFRGLGSFSALSCLAICFEGTGLFWGISQSQGSFRRKCVPSRSHKEGTWIHMSHEPLPAMLREISRQWSFDQSLCGVWGKKDSVSCVLLLWQQKAWGRSIGLF